MTQLNRIIGVLFVSLVFASGNAAALCVTSAQANLRSGPGVRYHKTWEVYRYMPLQKIGQKGAWLHVRDVDGERHWVHKNLVSSGIRCAVVKGAKGNVRIGPGTRYPQVGWSPVVRYYVFKVTGGSGRWAKLVDVEGDGGWMAKSLLWFN